MSVLSTLPSSTLFSDQCCKMALAIPRSKAGSSSLCGGVAAEAPPAARFGLTTCIGLDNIGVEWDLAVGVTPGAHGAWVTMEETSSYDEPSTTSSTGPYGCALRCPLRRDDGEELSLKGVSCDLCCKALSCTSWGIFGFSLPDADTLLTLECARLLTGRWHSGGASRRAYW